MKICKGPACSKKGANYIEMRLKSDLLILDGKYPQIETTPCQGFCADGPNIRIAETQYSHQNPSKASKLLAQYLIKKGKQS